MLIVGHKDGMWRIHNSWGKPNTHKYTRASVVEGGDGEEGEVHDILATDDWMRMHLFHAVVHMDVVRRPDPGPVQRLPHWDVLSTVAK